MKNDITPNEFAILKLLWKRGRLSKREIHDVEGEKNRWSYSTTRTVVDRMAAKGYVAKENFHGLNVYSSKIPKAVAYAQQVAKLAESVFELDSLALLPLFSDSTVLSPEELDSLRALLESKETEV